MARWEFKLPDLGEGVTEGEIVGWLVKVGDAVAEDQPMVEVMTDKATVTIAAPKAGAVLETHGQVGETIAVHAVLVVLDLDADTLPRRANGADKPAAGYFNDKPLATPATRKLARDRNVDLRRVPPTGPASRVTRADVEAFERAAPPPAAAASAPIDAGHPIATPGAPAAVAAP